MLVPCHHDQMVLGVIVDSEKMADAILVKLQTIFGARVFDTLAATIVEDHLGGEMDMRTAMIQRPDLFESAFIEILGGIGEKILAKACYEVQTQFHVDEKVATVAAVTLPPIQKRETLQG
jgi:hypothetical protein